jgi:hypothetical protein
MGRVERDIFQRRRRGGREEGGLGGRGGCLLEDSTRVDDVAGLGSWACDCVCVAYPAIVQVLVLEVEGDGI